MAKLYVANITAQARELHYRIMGSNGVFKVDIPPGGQSPFPRDMTTEEIHDIVQQQEPFGIVAAADVGQARKHVSSIWQIGAPIPETKMRQAWERNITLMGAEGLKLRQAAAVGVSQTMAEQDPDHYLGARVSIREKGDSPDVNEFHLHRQDGAYDEMGGMDTPVASTQTRRGRGRPRKGF